MPGGARRRGRDGSRPEGGEKGKHVVQVPAVIQQEAEVGVRLNAEQDHLEGVEGHGALRAGIETFNHLKGPAPSKKLLFDREEPPFFNSLV